MLIKFKDFKLNEGVNISTQTIEILKAQYSVSFYDNNINEVPQEQATQMQLVDLTVDYIKSHWIKAPKKEITMEYILSKIDKENIFVNLSKTFNKLIRKGINALPTTYGLGVYTAGYNNTGTKKEIEEVLNDLGITYTTETSDAGWVYRYKISKSKENIAKIMKL